APGPDTDTEKWIYLGENVVQDGDDGDWGEWGEWTRIPGHETEWFNRERTRIYAHGTWWDIDEPRLLGDDESKQYRYTESDSRTKPGTDEWVTIIRNLGPTSSEPDTAPFSIGRFQYRYTNVR